jgi:hypothetical protein
MKTAVNLLLSVFSQSSISLRVGCALHTIPVFRTRQARRFPACLASRKRHS